MFDLLQPLLQFPAVLYTVPLVVLAGYWLLVMVGVAQIELGADLDIDVDVDADPQGLGAIGAFFGLGRAPVIVVLSLFVFAGWATSFIAQAMLVGLLGGGLDLPVRVGIFLLSFAVATFSARAVTRLLVPVFRHVPSVRQLDVVGQECGIVTGRVDGSFGQGDLYTAGSALRVEVRCDLPNTLKHGDRALVAYFDEGRNAYIVEPLGPRLLTASPTE